ncbi:SIR2 family protein [Halopseudomonas pachastrellae]|mgnify:CR=1 FL=1|uniref:SIR2 family protein n=1 Tax=Pseudomonas sp. TaxID=306 RepID=UPI002C70C45E|nr:SIR2 family protein [Halopseudomonas pachastrellae]|tara:strand:- start:2908 stop:4299 length:1392 start_codon:yes stop_codon:yes gene_type:complete
MLESNDQVAPEEQAKKKTNILKVRDDSKPLYFTTTDTGEFELCDGSDAAWLNGEELNTKALRKHIEPWLTALFQSEHMSVLAGSGLTHAVHKMATGELAADMSGEVSDGNYKEKIIAAANESAKIAGREKSNIEDKVRVANELLRGLEILQKADEAETLRTDISNAMSGLAEAILKSEENIAIVQEEKRERAFNALTTFLMSFSSRTGTRDRLNIFTTNYDRLIEAGAELAGLHLLDRFVGNLMPIFRTSRLDLDMHYNPPGIRGEPRYLEGVARFTKLHGSVDWVQTKDDIRRVGLPFGADKVEPFFQIPGMDEVTPHRLMIYPNSAKDRETAEYPYVELFRDLAAAVCRPNSTLVTYGYSFGDEHINRVIRDMLTIPSTHLVVISMDDSLGRIQTLANERKSQVSLLIGPQLANLETLTESFLPKAAIDRTTFRMAELLKQRYGIDGQGKKTEKDSEEGAL